MLRTLLRQGLSASVRNSTSRSVQWRMRSDVPAGKTVGEMVPVNTFQLSDETKGALAKKGIETLFPIQSATFAHCFAGKDVVGRARTGTGKTLAFALPVVEKLLRMAPAKPNTPGVLIILPTRELAKQVCDEIISVSSGTVTAACFYGGTPYRDQFEALERGLDVAVGTPGRLLDHITTKRSMNISQVHTLVLDEADRMLDMGFSKDIERVVQEIGDDRQTLLFSATLPSWVFDLIRRYMKSPEVVDLIGDDDNQTAKNLTHLCARCDYPNKGPAIASMIKKYKKDGKVIVFVERKRDADQLARDKTLLAAAGRCAVLHGDVTQHARDDAMRSFKAGSAVLLATDIASRGIDVNGVDLVINADAPRNPESYVHRSGRTARAGQHGTCVTLFGSRDGSFIDQIRRHIKTQVCFSFSFF